MIMALVCIQCVVCLVVFPCVPQHVEMLDVSSVLLRKYASLCRSSAAFLLARAGIWSVYR